MMRVMESSGDRTLVWPSWCKGVDEVPYELMAAVSHATFILGASSNLSSEEQPPSWMWAFDDEIAAHFDRVKREREKKYGGKSSSDDDESGNWQQNELAANLKGD